MKIKSQKKKRLIWESNIRNFGLNLSICEELCLTYKMEIDLFILEKQQKKQNYILYNGKKIIFKHTFNDIFNFNF